MLYAFFVNKQFSISDIVNGILAGLVAITGSTSHSYTAKDKKKGINSTCASICIMQTNLRREEGTLNSVVDFTAGAGFFTATDAMYVGFLGALLSCRIPTLMDYMQVRSFCSSSAHTISEFLPEAQ